MEFPTYACWHCFFHSTMQSNCHSLVIGCRLAGACASWAVKLRFESWILRLAWGPKARLLSHLQSQEHHPGYRISKSFHMVVLLCSGLGWLACGLELCSPVSPRVLPRTFLAKFDFILHPVGHLSVVQGYLHDCQSKRFPMVVLFAW